MKAFGLALTIALAAAGAARAADDDDLRWLAPSFDTQKANWPHDSAGHLLYGEVKLDCGVGADGAATDCKVLSAEPDDAVLTKAALDLSKLFRAKEHDFQRAVVDLDLRFDQEPGLEKAPSASDVDAALSAEAKAAGGSGYVECVAKTDGSVGSCKVIRQYSKGPGYSDAALAIARLFKLKPATRLGRPVESNVLFPVSYGSPNDSNPDWLQRPTLDQLTAVYPAAAAAKGAEGRAVIRCVVGVEGLLHDCKVVDESPAGLGFGGAALAVAPTMLFKPATRYGKAVEAEITVPVNFKWPGGGGDHESPTATVLTEMIWAKTPSMKEILAELDKKVGDKFADGKVVFQCRISTNSGELSECAVANTSPGMAQFKNVANALTHKFKADAKALKQFHNTVRINLAFSFPNMQSEEWNARYLKRPLWVQTISPDANKATFPEAAAKAGLKTGSAVVDCVLNEKGALTQCKVASESTPDVGFGQMAQQIAQVFVANPWTEDGLPADGAHVRMPIQMNYDPPKDAPPADAAPATPPPAG